MEHGKHASQASASPRKHSFRKLVLEKTRMQMVSTMGEKDEEDGYGDKIG